MTIKEVFIQIDKLIKEIEVDQERAKQDHDPKEEMYCIGRVNGLLWAKSFLYETEAYLEELIKDETEK